MADGAEETSVDIGRAGLVTLVPPLVSRLEAESMGTGAAVHREIDGSLLSADISGFTRLTEQLAAKGRRGAEIITTIVNGCFAALIRRAESLGGEIVKFGGDAVLVVFSGHDHARRATLAGQTMQLALMENRHARENELSMTVGIATGPIHAMVVGSRRRDLLLCGPTVTETLQLEGAATSGEVAVSPDTEAAVRIANAGREGPPVVFVDQFVTGTATHPDGDELEAVLAPHVPRGLRRHFGEYADLGAEHRRAAIGFVLVEGVDDLLVAQGPEATTAVLSRLIDGLDDSVRPVGASFLHSDATPGGVKFLLGAGVPRSTAKPAEALLRATLDVVELDVPLTIRVGAQIGSVFAGFLGPSHRRTFTVMGDAVNTAARMSGQATDRRIVAVVDVLATDTSSFRTSPRDPVIVKGKSVALDIVEVDGLAARSQRVADERPLVGRDTELAWIDQAVGRSGAASIVGPPGSGKSRLLQEQVDETSAVLGACGPYSTASPYAPFWAAIRQSFGLGVVDDPSHAGRAVERLVRELAPDDVGLAPLVAPVFGAEVKPTAQSRAIQEEFRSAVSHRLVETLLSRRVPAVRSIVIEDVQWIDDASHQLVLHLADVAPERGWSVLTTARSDAVMRDEQFSGRGIFDDVLLLQGLDDAAIATLVMDEAGGGLDDEDTERLVRSANGNPMFAIELAAAHGAGHDEVPATIEEVIADRIERLAPSHRTAVRLASVLGGQFTLGDYAALVADVDHDAERDLRHLDELFDISDAGRVEFRQPLHREAAYGSLSFDVRRALHLTAGSALERTVDDADSIAALLSQHFEIGRDRRRCWTYSIAAARRANQQFSPGDAARLYRRALGNLPRAVDAAERCGVEAELGEALIRTGELQNAHVHFGRARERAASHERMLDMMSMQARCRDLQGRFTDALRQYSRVLRLAPSAAAGLRCDALLGRSSVMHRRGDNRSSNALAREALDLALVDGSPTRRGRARMMIHTSGEAFGAAGLDEVARAALVDFQTAGELTLEAELLSNLGVSAQLSGDLARAGEQYRRALDLKTRVGDVMGAAMIRMNLGEVELDRGETDGVNDSLEAALRTFERGGFRVGVAYTRGLLGRSNLLSGDLEVAVDDLTRAACEFDELGSESYSAAMELFLADALIRSDRHEEARTVVERNRRRLERGDVFDGPAIAAERLDRLDEMLEAGLPAASGGA